MKNHQPRFNRNEVDDFFILTLNKFKYKNLYKYTKIWITLPKPPTKVGIGIVDFMKVVSLFAGCGGLDLGLIKAGHKIVHASDIDKDCCETYNKNFNHKAICLDVKELKGSDLPNYDLLVGGFPCQGFSVANIYRSVNDKRNELYVEIVRLLRETNPKFFIAENVPGILSLEKGKVVELIHEEFQNVGTEKGNSGYEVRIKLLNASDYGVAQNRKRVIFFGVSKVFSEEQRKMMFELFPPPTSHGTERIPKKTLRDAIGDLPEPNSEEGKTILNHITTSHAVKINGYIGNRKLNWDAPGPTMVGRGGGTGGPVIAVHPNLKRRLSVRETARIQSFPDNFEFIGSKSSQYRQIGNAVAVEFAYNLGLMLKKIELLIKPSK
jgi:DNA (cytosine-5)-methyltransferase 1